MLDLYFSQIREDTAVERMVTTLVKPLRIVSIASGGCTSFSLLNDTVDVVYSVDLNPAQCSLVELKKAAMMVLNREEYLAFIGEKKHADRQLMFKQIRGQLPTYAKDYWDRHPQEIDAGINQCGVTERFYRFVGANIRNHAVPDQVWNDLFSCTSLDEQNALFDKHFTTDAWKTAAHILLSKTTHLLFFPAFMFTHTEENDFGAFFAGQFEKEVRTKPMGSNYFLSQLLFSSYIYDRPEGMPYYLTREGYDTVKRNLHKLVIVAKPLQPFLQDVKRIDAFYFSNVFDWAGAADCEAICKGVLQAKSAKAVLLYRNMLSAPPLPEFIMSRYDIDGALSARCLEQERSMMYRNITVGEVQ